jgi:hypothetical protein
MSRALAAVALAVALAGCSSSEPKSARRPAPSEEKIVAAVAPKLRDAIAAYEFPKADRDPDGKVRVGVTKVQDYGLGRHIPDGSTRVDPALVLAGLRDVLEGTGKIRTVESHGGPGGPPYRLTAALDDWVPHDGSVMIDVHIFREEGHQSVVDITEDPK